MVSSFSIGHNVFILLVFNAGKPVDIAVACCYSVCLQKCSLI